MKILFKYATRSRRSNFLRGIDSIINNMVNKKDYMILITVDFNDYKMFPVPQLNCNHTYMAGETSNKIEAINRNINDIDYDWDIVINMSDDMVFTKYGFDNIIRESFDKLDRFIHFPDGSTADRLCTMSIMGREYFNRFGYIYHPEYISLWADNEAQDVAKLLGCYKFIDNQIFEHLHPANGKGANDEQYIHTESFYHIDQQTYLKHKSNNFGLINTNSNHP